MLSKLELYTYKHTEIHDKDALVSMLSKHQVAYGTTENSPITFLGFPSDRLELKTDSVGYIMNHTEVWWSQPLNFLKKFILHIHI